MKESLGVLSTPIGHFNQQILTGQGVALVREGIIPRRSSLTLYIPEKIDIDSILEGTPPEFRYYRDNFLYIMSILITISVSNKDAEYKEGFVPVNKRILQGIIRDYRPYIEYLIDVGVLEEDKHYVVGMESGKLRFSNDYISKLKPVTITKWPLIKSILKRRRIDVDIENIETSNSRAERLAPLEEWFDGLEIEIESGERYLDSLFQEESQRDNLNEAMLKYNSRFLPLLKLKNKDKLFYIDSTGYRLHTNLTQLKSELRGFVRYDGNKILCAVDICNSQPYLALSLLSEDLFIRNNMANKINNPAIEDNIIIQNLIKEIEDKEDVILFRELVISGSLYEFFGEKLIEMGIIDSNSAVDLRKMSKEIMFTVLFSPNRSIAMSSVKMFRMLFPNVFRVFKLIKKGDGNHGALAICLQRLESELVLDRACLRISEERPDVPIFTLHDSIITTEENVGYVENVLENVLTSFMGVPPKFKIERWV